MYIKSLELTKFGLHDHRVFEFTSTSNLVVGDNMSGKSTIDAGIRYALFGAAAVEGKVEELVKLGARNFTVTLTLSDDTVITRTKNDAKVMLSGENTPIAVGTPAVNNYVSKLLNLSRDDFNSIFVVKRENIEEFLKADGIALQRLIERVLDLSRLDSISQAINQRNNVLKVLAADGAPDQEKLAFRKQKVSDLKDVVATLEANIAIKKAEAESFDEAILQCRDEKEWLTSELAEQRETALQHKNYDDALANAVAQLNTLPDDAVVDEDTPTRLMKVIDDGGVELAALTAQLAERKKELNQVTEYEEKKKRIEDSLTSLNKQKGGVAVDLTQLTYLEIKTETVREEIDEVSSEIAKTQELLAKVRSLDADILSYETQSSQAWSNFEKASEELKLLPDELSDQDVMEINGNIFRLTSENTRLHELGGREECPTCGANTEEVCADWEKKVAANAVVVRDLTAKRDEDARVRAKRNTLEATSTAAKSRIDTLSTDLGSAKVQRRDCTALSQTDISAHLATLKQTQTKLVADSKQLSAELIGLKTAKANADWLDSEIAKLKKELKSLIKPSKKTAEDLIAAYVDEETRRDGLKQSLENLRKDLRIVTEANNKATDVIDRRKYWSGNVASLVNKKAALPPLDAETEAMLLAKMSANSLTLNDLANKKSVAVAELHDCEVQLAVKNTQIEVEHGLISDWHEAKAKHDGVLKELNLAASVLSVLSAVRVETVTAAKSTISSVASNFVSAVTDGEVSDVDVGEHIAFTHKGNTFSKARASGAQRAMMAIGIKMGLATFLPSKLRVMLMDEATAAMSDRNSAATMGLLAGSGVQTIAVSFREDLADNIIQL